MPAQVREHWTFRTGLTGDCKPFDAGAESQTRVLCKSSALTADAALQPQFFCVLKKGCSRGRRDCSCLRSPWFIYLVCSVCVCMFLGVGGYAAVYLWCQNNLQKSVPSSVVWAPGVEFRLSAAWLSGHPASSSHACWRKQQQTEEAEQWLLLVCRGSVPSGWLTPPQGLASGAFDVLGLPGQCTNMHIPTVRLSNYIFFFFGEKIERCQMKIHTSSSPFSDSTIF